jgi:hypothetical protein
MRVPRAQRGGYSRTPVHLVTPEMLARTGHYLELLLHHFRPNVSMAQYLSTTLSAGLIAKETARRKLKAVPDPDRERDRIEDEQMHELPEVLFPESMARLDALIEQAEEEGDETTAQALMVARVALDYKYEQMVMAGAAPPGETAAGGGGAQPTPPPAVPPPTPARPQLPGNSLPQLGIGVGQQGGPPAGPRPPTQPTPPTRVSGQP